MLELKNISKTYEGRPLLKNISFMVQDDETICLLGASGSGKSTLLRIIAGLELPDEGSILFDGTDLVNTPTHLRDFGLVFQDYGLFPHLNIFDNIAYGLRMKKYSPIEIKQRVATLLSQVGLVEFENRNVNDLSGGEQQRVALARALAPNPRLLMFDEPLGALDRTLKEDLLNELRDILQQTKIPAIYVTHDQEEAFAIADRILLLHDGEIIREGTPKEIWNDPGSSWAAKFFGVGNIVEGVVNSSSGKVKTVFGVLDPKCKHQHSSGEKIALLIRQTSTGRQEIKVKVEDVLFKREQFQVKSHGALFYIKERPQMGQMLHLKVKVECVT
jgi:ABC-type Fe3+/spermidine/putrescine transport system ATPase subunit